MTKSEKSANRLPMDIDAYLVSPVALHQTESAEGRLLHPGQILDGFRILAFLGRGAASEVWRVCDERQDRDYALKIFAPPPNAPAQARQRFLTEARALDEFRHPNLMRRYQLQETGEHPYFTMDVLHPLPEKISRSRLLPLLEDILAGLSALHEKGIVHRDIKPANILLNGAGHAVLADLSVAHIDEPDLAKRLGDTATPEPTLACGSPFVGTPRYAAPEQLAGEAVSPATDIYALGVVLEELLDGQPPFLWKALIRRMTAARPALRLQTVQSVRRRVRFVRLMPWIRRTLGILAFLTGVLVAWHVAQPNWVELPEALAEPMRNPARLVITLDGGHYIQPSMRFQPLVGPAPANRLATTNAIDREFAKMLHAQNRRYPVFVRGHGTLKAPDLACCEIHLAPGVTFITTGRFKPDGFLVKAPVPPSDANWDAPIGYPAFVVEKGAKLIFTENADYPSVLIRRE